MLADTAEKPFSSKDWIFEMKWDGIRAISYIDEDFTIRSRNDKELRNNFPELEELRQLSPNTVLDGEIVAMKGGKADFQALMERTAVSSQFELSLLTRKIPITYIVFDILEKDGKTVIDQPLTQRKQILKDNLKEGKHVLQSEYVEGQGTDYYEAAVKLGIEGIIAKKRDSPYMPGVRSGNWLKIKKTLTCECAVFGYTKGEGSREKTFGALLLGLYDADRPVYVGKVGTGFPQKTLSMLMETFHRLKSTEPTLNGVDISEEITWLRPEIVCGVAYQSVTNDGKLRIPRFQKLRTDKPPKECTIEQLKQSGLSEYAAKRNFLATPEPASPPEIPSSGGTSFVVQEHHARRLHYDFRLEHESVLKSWAVPKGIPLIVGEKRLAVETEDHPLEYGSFEGSIPKGEYGAGTVAIWDKGVYSLKLWKPEIIEFTLKGQRLQGRYVLTKFKKAGAKDWLLLRVKDKNE
jgi:DNA ligase D-like protein (predicted ligase)/DNA ligase D-like protein (predicted 3'-phosphoesterase)